MPLPDAPNALETALIEEIAASGPISVAEFMERANGLYYADSDPLGTSGDFITSPEISQMFGELVGLWLVDLWVKAGSPAQCHYVELGPGRGTLAADALRSMAKFGLQPKAHFVEMNAALREKQAGRVAGARFHDTVTTLPDDGPLLMVANEFFDALPIRQIERTADGWRERMVGLDAQRRLCFRTGLTEMEAVIPPALRDAPGGTIAETCPQGGETMLAIARRLESQGGVALIVDYGHAEIGAGDTLQAVRGQERADILADPGRNDLSAHVNFPELAAVASIGETRVLGPVDQGRWLKALGIDLRCKQLADANPGRAGELRAAVERLTSPVEMGTLFKVMAVASARWPVPEGFS